MHERFLLEGGERSEWLVGEGIEVRELYKHIVIWMQNKRKSLQKYKHISRRAKRNFLSMREETVTLTSKRIYYNADGSLNGIRDFKVLCFLYFPI